MDELIAFLRAALDEDERVAHAATSSPWMARRAEHSVYAQETSIVMGGHDGGWYIVPHQVEGGEGIEPADADHIARWDPKRVLDEIKAKRRVIDALRGYEPNDEWDTEPDMGLRRNNAAGALRALAQPYADRPGFREEWRA